MTFPIEMKKMNHSQPFFTHKWNANCNCLQVEMNYLAICLLAWQAINECLIKLNACNIYMNIIKINIDPTGMNVRKKENVASTFFWPIKYYAHRKIKIDCVPENKKSNARVGNF